MKKFYSFFLFVLCVAALNAQRPNADEIKNWEYINGATYETLDLYYEAPLVSEMPDIDGDSSDAAWAKAPWYYASVLNLVNSDWRGTGSPDTLLYDWAGVEDYNFRFKVVHDGSTYAMLMHITDDELNYADLHNGYSFGSHPDFVAPNQFEGTGDAYHWWRMDVIEWYMAPKSMADTITAIGGNGRTDRNLQEWHNVYTGAIESDYENAEIMARMKGHADFKTPETGGFQVAGEVDDVDYIIEYQAAHLDSIALDVQGITTGDTLIFDIQADDADSEKNARDYIIQITTVFEEARKDATYWLNIVLSDKDDTYLGEQTAELLAVFPNPAKGQITLSKVADVEIYNISGQLEISKTNTNKVDISSLQTGIYFVKAQGQITKLVVK